MTTPRVWLITGATSGFGLELAKVAAERGDLVIGTSRNPSSFTAPLPSGITLARLDHNEPLASIKKDVAAIFAIHGTVDVVVNNAAYVQTGTVEELTPEETLKQFRANVFGPVNVYRAVLPHLRAKPLPTAELGKEEEEERGGRLGKGALVTIGSMSAWYQMDSTAAYMGAKAALRQITLGMAAEVAAFGVRHTLVEPGFFRTELLRPEANLAGTGPGNRIDAYAELNKKADDVFRAVHGKQLGDARKGCEIIYEVVTGTGVASGRELPAELPLGGDAVVEIARSARRTIDAVERWADVAKLSDIPAGQ
ncbi:uncharacterized protein F4807DRAFT_462911 [Annulohypoxylon truncatum]|uniref:uncharacterized protein n=1 Tax=Annulohypoxylon truncatum TaxID=327061 RepID=UPI0020080914|nr:uncharacterized protein F4807DRAFT_462911 [Annulohypoxylon truncatum]KAI1207181.1 hypothetical protein F4807DRAFT_462911 [Annulohypoxylon truncatum]